MPLAKQTIRIPLTGGLDTKSDPRAMRAPKLAVCKNAVFDELGGVQKRLGFASMGVAKASGGSITAARMRALGVRGDELILFAEGRCYSRTEADDEWQDRGRFESFLVSQKTVAFAPADQVLPDSARAGGVVVRAWEDRSATPSQGVRYACFDSVTGARFESQSEVFVSGATRPRCIALNGKLLVFYFIVDGTNNIRVDVIDPADVRGTLGQSPVTITTSAGTGLYDIDDFSSTLGVIAWSDGTNARVANFDSAATLSNSRDTGRGATHMVAINYNATSTKAALLRFSDPGATTDLRLDWLKNDLTDEATVNIDINIAESAQVHNIAVASLTGQTAYVFWDQEGSPTPNMDRVYRARCNSSGLVAGTNDDVFVRRARIGSRARVWSDGSTERVMIHVFHSSNLQSQYVLLDAGFVVGKTNGTAVDANDEVGLLARLFPGEGPSGLTTRNSSGTTGGLYRDGHLPQIESLGSNKYAVALTYRRFVQISATVNQKTREYHERGIREVTYTAFDSRAFQGQEEGGALYGPGGYVWMYDGRRVVEAGAWLFPEEVTLASSNGAGALDNSGKYVYRIFECWENAAGELERSTHAKEVSITLGAADNTVTVTIPCNTFTNKINPDASGNKGRSYFEIYRNESIGGVAGTTFYLITSNDPGSTNYAKRNDPNAESVQFTDLLADTAITSKPTDYLSSGEFENVASQPSPFLVTGQARAFVRDPENDHRLFYSKLRLDGFAVAFNDSLELVVPHEGGAVNYVVPTEGALLILCDKAIYVATGQGLTNTGGDSPYSSPQRIADVGCIEPRSVVRTPAGVFFQSRKGIYRISAGGGQVDYVGAGVEDYNSVTITGAVHIPDKHRVHLLTSNSGILIFDYLVGEWSVWDDGAGSRSGTSMVLWRNNPAHLESTAPFEPRDDFYDGTNSGYPLELEIAWNDVASVQRIYRVSVLGEYRSAHDLRLQLKYNHKDTVVHSATFAITSDAGPYRYRVTPTGGYGRSSAIKVRIDDQAPSGGGNWRESMKLTWLELVVGVYPGRLPVFAAAQTK